MGQYLNHRMAQWWLPPIWEYNDLPLTIHGIITNKTFEVTIFVLFCHGHSFQSRGWCTAFCHPGALDLVVLLFLHVNNIEPHCLKWFALIRPPYLNTITKLISHLPSFVCYFTRQSMANSLSCKDITTGVTQVSPNLWRTWIGNA